MHQLQLAEADGDKIRKLISKDDETIEKAQQRVKDGDEQLLEVLIHIEHLKELQAQPDPPQCTGWGSLAIPGSIRRPWDILQESIGDKIEDARDNGMAAPADVADQQAAILTKGARDVFCELPRQERLALTEVSLTELAAYTMWKACILDGLAEDEATPAESTLHTAWDLVSDEDKPEWVPDSPRTCLAADPFWALLLEAEPRPDPPSRRSRSPSSCSSDRSDGSFGTGIHSDV